MIVSQEIKVLSQYVRFRRTNIKRSGDAGRLSSYLIVPI